VKKLIMAGASLAVIPALLLAGCSQDATSQDQEPKSKEKSEVSSDEQEATSEPASQPSYQAIKPSEVAQPLKSHYTETQLAEMPKTEAHGDDTERSVPLGQTLEKGTEDETDGPLQKNRIVSYYGHPD
jgi:hypothetical protein